MKKYLILPAIIGLVAVPSLAFAQHDSSTNPAVIGQGVSASITKPMIANTDLDDSTTVTTSTSTTVPTTKPDETKPPIVVPEGSLTADQAQAVAVALYPDKTFAKVETEMEHGVLVYEVKFTDGTEVSILASDGSVIATETEHTSLRTSNSNANEHATNKHNEGKHLGQLKHDD
jgi:uncharacterized membrane protein YkoI